MSNFPESLLLIGAGKMGSALLKAWKEAGIRNPAVVESAPSLIEGAFSSLEQVTFIPECVVLAVKPQSLDGLMPQLNRHFGTAPLYISIAAGKTLAYFEKHLPNAPVIRVMPNTPALIGKGISAMYANAFAGERQKRQAETLLAAAGETLWLDKESLMDAVTALSGSGPAYVFLLMEAMVKAGVQHGLSETLCKKLVVETIIGSAELAKQSPDTLTRLRENVTSKGGTTEAALNVLMADNGLKHLMEKAITKAALRAGELAV